MTWRDKILEGYSYQIGDDNKLIAYTGSGGAIMFGEALEEKGLPDSLIQDSIKVHLEGKSIKLRNLGVKKNN